MTAHLDQLLQKFNAEVPLERAHTIPSAWYFDPEIYAAGVPHVFGGTWQVVGRARSGRRNRASFVTADVAGEPILVVRDGEGVAAGASTTSAGTAPPRSSTSRRARRPSCAAATTAGPTTWPGRLRGTPEFDGVQDFCREDKGLAPLAVDAWGPLVFVHAGADRRAAAGASSWRRCPSARPAWAWRSCASSTGASTSWPATGRCSSITTWTAATTSTRSIPAWPASSTTPTTARRIAGNTSVQISPLKPGRRRRPSARSAPATTPTTGGSSPTS